MIGDSTWDAQAALAAGAAFVGVPADGFDGQILGQISTAKTMERALAEVGLRD